MIKIGKSNNKYKKIMMVMILSICCNSCFKPYREYILKDPQRISKIQSFKNQYNRKKKFFFITQKMLETKVESNNK